MKRRRFPLAVESLEGKTLLSSGLAAPVVQAAAQVHTLVSKPILLNGTIAGAVRLFPATTPGGSPVVGLAGAGKVSPLGTVTARAVSLLATLQARHVAVLTMGNTSGIVFVALQPLGTTTTTLPTQFRFTIIAGTGAFTGATGTGTVRVTLPNGPPTSLTAPVAFRATFVGTRA